MPLPIPPEIPVSATNGIVAVDGVGVFVSDTLEGQVPLAREVSNGTFETIRAHQRLRRERAGLSSGHAQAVVTSTS